MKQLSRFASRIMARSYALAIRVRPLEMVLDWVLFKLAPNRGSLFVGMAGGTSSMAEDWDRRARANALVAATGTADEEAARASVVKGLPNIFFGTPAGKDSIVLEIGCGIGNVMRAISPLVRELHGVDISDEMLARAAERLQGCPNASVHKTEGTLEMFPDGSFDFVYCTGAFIHFPLKEAVYRYFSETARVLKPGGFFRLHVDGRAYLRWRSQRAGTLRGVTFTEDEIRHHLEDVGLGVVSLTGAGTSALWATAERRPA